MNILINGACNKNCSFCFEGDKFRKTVSNMSLDRFEEIVNNLIKAYHPGVIRIQILGGEPALHPQFEQMLDLLIKKELEQNLALKLSIITNGFRLDKYLDKLMEFRSDVGILLNASSMEGDHEEMSKLLDLLIQYSKKTNNKIYFTPGFTVYDKSIAADLNFLINKYSAEDIYMYRVTPATPSASEIEPRTFEHYVKIKKLFLEAIHLLSDNGRRVTSECDQVPTCAFTEEEYSYYINSNIALDKWAGVERTLAKCHTAVEIMPNGDFIGCVPIDGYIPTKKYWDFNNDLNRNHDFIVEEKNKLAAKRFNEKADVCLECPLYKKKICYGGCLVLDDPFPHDPAIKDKFEWMERLTGFQWKE